MYDQRQLEAEVACVGDQIHELSSEGKAYLNQLILDDFTRARAEAEARIARRVAREDADRLIAEHDNAALVAEIQAAVRSAASGTPSAPTYAEREHQRRLESQWGQYT